MSRKVLIFGFLLLFAAFAEVAAQDMRSLFVNAPDTVLPLLTRTNREDCIDFLDAKMRARVTNRLDGKSELMKISPTYLELLSSSSSTVQMKLLPFGTDSIVAVVRTVCAEACSSSVEFYNRDWTRAAISFSRPSIEEFFVSSDSVEYSLSLCDIYLVRLSLSPDEDTLTAEYTMPRYMNKEDAEFISSRIKTIVYRWRGTGFVKE